MAGEETLEQFTSCWEGLEDPRSGNATLHDFHELLMIALCCVLCGGQGPTDMALFARAKEAFLRSFLVLANGLPSHHTFRRQFHDLDPDQFRDAFQQFMSQFSEQMQAWSPSTGMSCVTRFTGPVARVRYTWFLPGVRSSGWCWRRSPPMPSRTIVTADALNCQRSIAEQIVEQKGDYALALKGNQGTLYDDVDLLLDDAELKASTGAPVVEADHGRIETRTATISNEIDWLQQQHQLPGLKVIGKVVRVR